MPNMPSGVSDILRVGTAEVVHQPRKQWGSRVVEPPLLRGGRRHAAANDKLTSKIGHPTAMQPGRRRRPSSGRLPAAAPPAPAAPVQHDASGEGRCPPVLSRGAGGASPPSVPMGERTLVREELVEAQEEVISSLRTQLAAMTRILQQGVQIPIDDEICRAARHGGEGGRLHVSFESKWQWRVEAPPAARTAHDDEHTNASALETTHLGGMDQPRGWRPRRQQ